MRVLVHFKNSGTRPVRLMKLVGTKLEFITEKNLKPADRWALGFEDGNLYPVEEPNPDALINLEDEEGFIDSPFYEWNTEVGFERYNLEQLYAVARLMTGRDKTEDISAVLNEHMTRGLFEYFDKIGVEIKNELIAKIYEDLILLKPFYWETAEDFFKGILFDLPRINIVGHTILLEHLWRANVKAEGSKNIAQVHTAPVFWSVCENCETIDGCSNTELNYLGIVTKSYAHMEPDPEEDDGYELNSCASCGSPDFIKTPLETPAIVSTKVPTYLKLFQPVTTGKEMAQVMKNMHDAEVNPAKPINRDYTSLMDSQVEAPEDDSLDGSIFPEPEYIDGEPYHE